ncbi:MAG: response regulator [Myxococcales bacterium]|nr:response regulator [Myxococcota bacterium]MDW8282230.1 response regulator [Myxococcales bacterium]
MSTPRAPGPSSDLVLVVDDDADLLEMLEVVLRMGNCRVVRASSGRAAMELLRAEQPALVLLDLMLPDMRGEELFEQLRSLQQPPPVVVMSAAVDTGDRARRLGVPYLIKPFDVEGLMALVRQVCPSAVAL